MNAITTLLLAARQGDDDANRQLYQLLYGELREIASAQLRRLGVKRDAMSHSTTSLLHDSYLKLVANGELLPADRRHFFAYAAKAMRSVVIDFIRGQQAAKRGGAHPHTAITTNLIDSAGSESEALHVHDALEELTAIDTRLAQIVEMRYFAGLTESETAEALDISLRTVQRDWEKARLYLAYVLRH